MPAYPSWLPLPVAMLAIPLGCILAIGVVDYFRMCIRVEKILDEVRDLRRVVDEIRAATPGRPEAPR